MFPETMLRWSPSRAASVAVVVVSLAMGATACSANVNVTSNRFRDPSKPAYLPVTIVVVDGKKIVDYGGRSFEFEYGSARLVGDATFDALVEVRDFLRKNATLRIEVEGHTDSRGSEKANDTLSKKRAQAIVDNLVNNGIDPKRLRAVGLGEDGAESQEGECFNHKTPDDAAVTRKCESAWRKSRRAVLRVVE